MAEVARAVLGRAGTPQYAHLQLNNLRGQCAKLLNFQRAWSGQPNATIKINASWEISEFLREEFTPAQLIADIFVLTGSVDRPVGSTCGEFMEYHWPRISDFVLNTIQAAISELNMSLTFDAQPNNHRVYNRKSMHCTALELQGFSWYSDDITDMSSSMTTHTKDVFSLTACGPDDMVLDFIEAFCWLGAALRPTDGARSGGLSISNIAGICRITSGVLPTISLECWLPRMETVEVAGRCWHSLFKNPSIVDYVAPRLHPSSLPEQLSSIIDYVGPSFDPTSPREQLSSYAGYGLKLKLRDLIGLSGADLLMEYNGGLVYFGYSSILVPIRTLAMGDIQWHLLRQEDPTKMISLTMIDTDKVCQDRELIIEVKEDAFNDEVVKKQSLILFAKSHFLGLWPEALISLGTAGHDYTALSRGEYTANEKVQTSETYNAILSAGLSGPIAGFGKAVTYGKKQTYTDYNQKKGTCLKILGDFRKQAVLVYESDEARRRAWLVPKLSMVLHAAHLYFRSSKWEGGVILDYADLAVDGDEAAWKILTPNDDFTTVKGYTGTTIKDREQLNAMLTRIVGNMVKLDAKAVSQSLASRIYGYDMADLPTDPKFRPVYTDFKFATSRQGWWLLTEKVPMYHCLTTPPPVRQPYEIGDNGPLELPKDHLICPMTCLDMQIENTEKLVERGMVTRKLHFHSPHEPFGDCVCRQCSGVPKELDLNARVQYLIKNGRRARKWDRMSLHMKSAVLISPKSNALHKSLPKRGAHNGLLQSACSSTSLVASVPDDGSDSDSDSDYYDTQQHFVETLPGGEEVIIKDGNQETQEGQPGSSGRQVNQESDLGLGYPESNRHLMPRASPLAHRISISPDALANSINNGEDSQHSVTNGKGKGKAPVRDPPNHPIRPTAASSAGESSVTRPDDTSEPAASGKSNKPLAVPVGKPKKRNRSLLRSAGSRFRE